MAFCGGRRRPRKRQKKNQEHFLVIIGGAVFFFFALLCIPADDIGDVGQGQSSRGSSTLRLERCRSSCEDVILHSGGSLSDSLLSSSAVASSAVDALFSLRDADVAESPEEPRANRKSRRRKSDRKQIKQSKASKKDGAQYDNGDDFWANVDPPPTRLPPLIETLVGSVGGSHHYRGYGRQGEKKGLIAQGNNSFASAVSGDSQSPGVKTRGEVGSADESVAMAAAAAAAAFWSQTTGRGRHRMKSINEEWEKSLLWIAGWGQSPEAFESANASPHAGERGNRKSVGKGKHRPREGVDVDDLRLSFLDACIEECVGDSSSDSGRSGHSLGQWPKHGSQLVLSFVSSLLTGKTATQWGSVFDSERRNVIMGMIRIALSSAFLFALTSAWQWFGLPWSSHKKESTAWLLEQEMVENKGSSKTARKSSSKKKASISRRSRRRNHSTKTHRDISTGIGKEEPVHPLPSSINDSQDEDEVDLDCLQRLIPVNVKRQASQKKKGGNSSRRVTPYQPSSRSSSLEENASTCPPSAPSEHTMDLRKDDITRTKPCNSSEAGSADEPFIPVSVSKANKQRHSCCGTRGKHAGQLEAQPLSPLQLGQDGPDEISGDLLVTSASPSSDFVQNTCSYGKHSSLLGTLQHNSPAVPTDEQREMAFRQLREYQRVQVLKIMQRKGLLCPSKTNDVATPGNLTASAIPVASTAFGTSVSYAGRCGREAAVIGPPPGLGNIHTGSLHSTLAGNSQHETDDVDSLASSKLLPSNILDGFEDEQETNPPATRKSKVLASSEVATFPKAYSPVLTGFGVCDQSFSAEHAPLSSRSSCWGPLKPSLDATHNVTSSGQTGSTTRTLAFEIPLDTTTLSSWTSSDGSDGGSSVEKPNSW